MKIKPFQALYPNLGAIDSPDAFCECAKDAFPESREQGMYQEFPEAALYVYQIEDGHRKHTGLIAMNELADFRSGKIKKHENTIHEKEKQQMELFLYWKAILKPVLLTYPSIAVIEHWLQEYISRMPAFFTTRFQKDGQVHRMWPVQDPQDIELLQKLFAANVPAAYIADGHHRTTSVALLQEQFQQQYSGCDFDHLFCIFIGADELDILDFNRVVEISPDLSADALISHLSQVFEILPLGAAARRPSHKYEIILHIADDWYALQWKTEILDGYPPEKVLLDVSLLNELVLKNILGMHDIRTDSRIRYVEGSQGIEGFRRSIASGRNRIGFMLFPVSLDDMMHIADAGESLPPKSTYFEPRIRTGMMVKMIC
jgi:uncharacterized protein (DUF1015 family)